MQDTDASIQITQNLLTTWLSMLFVSNITHSIPGTVAFNSSQTYHELFLVAYHH